MKISFGFQGWVTADIDEIYEVESGKDLQISDFTDDEVLEGLESGKFALSFHSTLAARQDTEVEMFDYEIIE